MNSKTAMPPLFLDRSVGTRKVAAGLRALGLDVQMIDRIAQHRTAIELAAAESGPWVRHLTQHALT